MRTVDTIIIHCSYTPVSMNIGADEIRQWHLSNGWKDIGYNYVVKRNGDLDLGRDLDGDGNVDEEVGAHTMGFNSHSIGICLIGGKPYFNFTRPQMGTLDALVTRLWDDYSSIVSIRGHNDFTDAKTCPTFDVKEWFPASVWTRTGSAVGMRASSPKRKAGTSAPSEAEEKK